MTFFEIIDKTSTTLCTLLQMVKSGFSAELIGKPLSGGLKCEHQRRVFSLITQPGSGIQATRSKAKKSSLTYLKDIFILFQKLLTEIIIPSIYEVMALER